MNVIVNYTDNSFAFIKDVIRVSYHNYIMDEIEKGVSDKWVYIFTEHSVVKINSDSVKSIIES